MSQALQQRLRQRLQAQAPRQPAPDMQWLTHRRAGVELLLGGAAEAALRTAQHWVDAALHAGVPLPAPQLQALALRVLAAPDAPPDRIASFAARAWVALAPHLPAPAVSRTRDALWRQLQPAAAMAPALPTTPAPGALQAGEHMLVADAGLVLCAPFLGRLWQRLALLSPDGQGFATPAACARAAQLLRLLASGRTDTPEHLLGLPRLLCALPEQQPLDAELQPTPAEHEAVDGLLVAMIRHWKRLGRTSPAGLRDTFLQRPGLLERGQAHWRLRVESRAFDMLLDDLPWAFKTVRLPWMPEVLHVEWR